MSRDDIPDEGQSASRSGQDARIDEEEEESFPASDPPSSWAGPNSEPEE